MGRLTTVFTYALTFFVGGTLGFITAALCSSNKLSGDDDCTEEVGEE